MIIGTAGVDTAMVVLDAALILAIASAAKLYDASVRTSVSASGLERGLGLDENLYAEVPAAREQAKILTIVAAALCAVAAAGILAFAVTNQGTETDDDDDDRKTSVTEEKSESESDDD